MNVAQVSSNKKRKGCSPLESKCENYTDLKCKRPRFADKRHQEAKANHDLDVTSLKPPQKRQGVGQASDYSAKKKKPGLETIVEDNAATSVRPRERKKKVACQLKKQAPSARGDDADEAQLIEELRSGVTSILRGLEPEETSPAASRVAKTRLRDSVGGAIEKKIDTPTHGSSAAYPKGTSTLPTNEKVKKQKATGNMKEASKAEEEARRSFSDFTLEEREPLANTHNTASNFDTDQEVSSERQIVGKQIDPSLGAGKASSKKRRAFYLASSADVRERALARIRAAQFRMLNEELYTTASEDAVQSFESDPQSFQVYHEGFEQQVSKWPVNPVDVIIESLYSMPKSTIIADLGCGEAKIAQALTRNKVHSFDIVALNEHVTICDMSKLPLPNQTIDVAVFCLSLMGTNLNMFVLEANRILKKGGILKIAEVKSRFSTTQGFAKTMKKFGFELEHLDDSNKMFVLFDFKKARSTTAHPHLPTLKLMPCLYKKR
ncbi:hypothetical protein HPB50_023222 [Hyalomma asiaticum]|uniref:Uncharacterized protein n=1 Tax=Hyalomma asiaticum TaxID=266040 RepID=A0ACB7SRZ5_HYAAI|nr:hypothetical protein HPB50_023222 [Hyalomma asiaticum]